MRTTENRQTPLDENDGADSKYKVAIPRHLGLVDCIWHLIGSIIGTGIFISPTGVLRGAGGSVGVSFILWIVCAMINACGALTLAELSVIMKKSGGDFTFILQAWGPLMAFIRLWVIQFIIAPSGGAIGVMTISRYLLTPFFQCAEAPVASLRLVSVICLLFVQVINCFSVRLASKLAGVLSITKVAGLVIIVITGLHNLTLGHTEHFQHAFNTGSYDVTLLPTGLLSGIWAYSGWSVITSITEEVKNPQRNRHEVAYVTEVEGLDSSDSKVFIPRHIGLLGVISHTMATVIGTGIFISPKGVLQGAGGSVGLALIFWVICGVIQTCGCFIYSELALMFRKSGGEFTFMLEGWGRTAGFLKLWTIVTVNSASMAIQAQVVSQYLLTPFLQCVSPPLISLRFISFCAFLLMLFGNCVSAKLPTRIAGFFTMTKTFGLLVVIVSGIYNLTQGRTTYLQNAFETSNLDVTAIPLAVYSGMFAFHGWDVVMSLTEEIKRPERNLPLGVAISMATITILYTMANISYFTLLSPQDVLESDAVAADYSVLTLGRWSWLIWLFVALSAMGNLNSYTCKHGRQVFAASREGLFPEITSMLNVRYNTPIPAILTLALSLLYLIETRVISLIRYLMFIETIFDTMTVAVLPYFRWKYPDLERPFRAPMVMVVIYMSGQIFIAGMSFYLDPMRKSVGLFIVLVGLPVYFFFFDERFKLKSIEPYTHKMTKFLQRLFYCVHQEKKTF